MILLALILAGTAGVPDLPVVKLKPGGPGAMEGVTVEEQPAPTPAGKATPKPVATARPVATPSAKKVVTAPPKAIPKATPVATPKPVAKPKPAATPKRVAESAKAAVKPVAKAAPAPSPLPMGGGTSAASATPIPAKTVPPGALAALVPQKAAPPRLDGSAKPAATPPAAGDPVGLNLVAIRKSGAWPKGVELTPDGTMAMTSDFSSNTLTLVNTSSLDVVATIPIGKDSPVEIAWLPGGTSAFITGGYELDRSFVFDLETRKVTKWIPGAKNRKFPKVPVLSPDGSEVWVSYWASNTVGVIDSTTFEVKATIPVGPSPRGIAFTPDGKKAYVCNFCNACSQPSTIHVIDVATRKRLSVIKGVKQPRHAVTSPDGSAVYVSVLGGQKIVKIDTATDTIVEEVKVGKLPKTIKLSADGRFLFVANYGSDTIMVVDTTLMQVVTKVKAGKQPSGLSVSADGRRLWTTDWSDGTIRIFDIAWPVEGPPMVDPAVAASAP